MKMTTTKVIVKGVNVNVNKESKISWIDVKPITIEKIMKIFTATEIMKVKNKPSLKRKRVPAKSFYPLYYVHF